MCSRPFRAQPWVRTTRRRGVGKAIVATGSLVSHTVLMLLALFFMLVHGHEPRGVA